MSSLLLDKISSDLLIPKQKLDYLIRSTPYRYKVFKIKKNSGNGFRTIAQPAREIKKIQYWIISNIFIKFKIHNSATAYIKNRNIFYNAAEHSSNPYILKLDFKNFFNSIDESDINKYFNKYNIFNFSDDDITRLCKILLWKPEKKGNLILSIGAPSSPFISNAIMYDFDCIISDYCNSNNIKYTRYADDIIFSMDTIEKRSLVYEKTLSTLDDIKFPTLKINHEKTIFGSKANRRLITGLIITNDCSISLGRDRKRNIRSQIHYLITGKLSHEEMVKLRGLISFAENIEPDFIERMKQKYGIDFINFLRS